MQADDGITPARFQRVRRARPAGAPSSRCLSPLRAAGDALARQRRLWPPQQRLYYSLFDTVVNGVLIEAGALDIEHGQVADFVVETRCSYFAPLAFPQALEGGLRVARVGASSVRYEIGIFAAGAAQTAARGHFVHVYVDRATQRPVALPPALLDIAKDLA